MTIQSLARRTVLFSLPALLAVSLPTARAAMIDYGSTNDFSGGGKVAYLDITESSDISALPLYGTPQVSVNTLDFDPDSFGGTAIGGASNTVNGMISFGVQPQAGYYLDTVALQEFGDYTMVGAGTTQTVLQLSAPVTVTITEVDNAPITPVVITTALTLAPSASGHYDLTNDSGVNVPWQGDLLIDLDVELDIAGVSYTFGATSVEISIDNTMGLQSETASSVSARLGDTAAVATVSIPEPTTLVLALAGACGLALARRRR
jgi:hypothetical protein